MSSLRRTSRIAVRLAVLLAVSLPAAWAQVAAVTTTEYVEAWKASKAYTRAVAEAMPAEGFSFQPTPDQFTFAVQMIHIAHANYAWFAKVLGEERSIADPRSEEKADVLPYLEATFDYCIAALERMTPGQLSRAASGVPNRPNASSRDALLNMYMHTAHHRGQAIIYLRLKGVEPPQYRY
jgi:uncharacterized damage-inducible protein DinB